MRSVRKTIIFRIPYCFWSSFPFFFDAFSVIPFLSSPTSSKFYRNMMIGKMQHGHLEGVCLFRGVEMIEIEEAIYLLVRILDIFS